jgi:serine/threonine-protein kinase
MTSLLSALTLGKKIGEGFFGEVFLGNDPVHGTVAVKRIVKDPAKPDSDWLMRKQGLLREAQFLKQATHRNVVKVHHLLEDETGEAILFVMDYCSGGSLQDQYEKGPMSFGPLRKIITDVAQGLQALHAREMLHRDIKPGNILINANGDALLGDFGHVTDYLIHGYGSQAGYWDHIAPEVHAGGGTSVKTDIWALGMTIYRLLHGEAWYEESEAPRHLIPIGGFSRTLRWLPHVPQKWRRLVRNMLHDDTHQRCPTATALFAALSSLPTTPSWEVRVTAAEITWERNSGTRRISVVWQRHSPRRHEWFARSEPLTAGRVRTLGSSGGIVSRAVAERSLQDFFETQH